MITISLDFHGCYLEHKEFFDEMAKSMQDKDHRIGIITGERESKREFIARHTGFMHDFVHLWGEYETISNGNLWKCQQMDKEDVLVHFDDDAKEMKKYTDRWIIKVMCGGVPQKF